MACALCSPISRGIVGPCRHEIEGKRPTLSWRETTPEINALVDEMQDVLRVDQQRGIAKKHLDDAYRRGYRAAVGEARNAISRYSHAID